MKICQCCHLEKPLTKVVTYTHELNFCSPECCAEYVYPRGIELSECFLIEENNDNYDFIRKAQDLGYNMWMKDNVYVDDEAYNSSSSLSSRKRCCVQCNSEVDCFQVAYINISNKEMRPFCSIHCLSDYMINNNLDPVELVIINPNNLEFVRNALIDFKNRGEKDESI